MNISQRSGAPGEGADPLLTGLMGCAMRLDGAEAIEAATVYAEVLRCEAVRRAALLAVDRINADSRLSKRARAIVVAHIQAADATWHDAPALRIFLEEDGEVIA